MRRRLLLLAVGGSALVAPARDLCAQRALVPVGARLPGAPLGPPLRTVSPLPSVRLARDTVSERAGWPPGVAGAMIGSAVGLAAGAVLVRGLCDVPDCASHPDTRKLLLGGAFTGAVAGVVVELVWRAARDVSTRALARGVPGRSASHARL